MGEFNTNSALNGEERIAKKRSKNPGVRVIGSRIYDSENGKTCHQCRQKTRDFAALCKSVKKAKLCSLIFCHKCLLNRYGEKAEEVDKFDDWSCPRCREICNCSFCMKRKGQQPTGILVHAAKATGFNSVKELLQNKGFEVLEIHNLMKDARASPNKSPLSNKVLTGSKRKYDNKNQGIVQNEAISIDEMATREKKDLKKGDKNAASEKRDLKKGDKNAASEKRDLKKGDKKATSEKRDLEKGDKKATSEKRDLKKAKLIECGESKNEAISIDEKATRENKDLKKDDKKATSEKRDLKKVKLIECEESQNEAISIDEKATREKMDLEKSDKKATNEKKDLKKAKLIKCGESQVPTANHAKQSKLKNYFKKCQASDNSQTQKIAVITKFSKSKIDLKDNVECKQESIMLPLAKPLLEVAEYQLPAQDVGAALQFLEFCNSFSEILNIKKGQPECILRDITKGHAKRLRSHSALAQFCIKLLALIYDDVKKDGDAWLQSLRTCIEESECELKELAIDSIKGSYGFENLEPSQKLLLLNFLCDEVLLTEKLRKFIDEVKVKFDKERKETKQKVADAKKKEKLIKQTVRDEVAKAMLSGQDGKSLSISELDEILSKLRTEADKVLAEVSTSLELKTPKNQRSDVVRTAPVIRESNGKTFWKLSSYGNSSTTILQEIGNWDSVTLQDKWFVFNDEEEKVVDKYVHSLRNSSVKRCSTDDAEDSNKPVCQASETEVAEKIEVCGDKFAQ